MILDIEPQNLPALHQAAYEGDLAAIRHLVSDGADVNSLADTNLDFSAFLMGVTPLMLAAESTVSSLEAVQLLLDLGANPIAQSARGVTALWYAAGSPDHRRVALLLKAGGDVRETARNGRTALCEAASIDNVESVRLLLDAGALPEPTGTPPARTNLFPLGPEFAAVREYMARERTDSWLSYMIPLFTAAASGGAQCIPVLVQAGAHPDFRDDSGGTALMYAASAEAVDALVQAGCPLYVRDQFDHSALDHALEDGYAEAAKALIRAGVNIEAKDQYGRTALMCLCGALTTDSDMVRLLIAAGADVYVQAESFGTALHCAAQLCFGDRRGQLGGIIRELVAAGLPVDVRDEKGKTALHRAVGDEGMDVGAVEALLELGADPNARSAKGKTPLMTAARYGSNRDAPEVVRRLLAQGGNPWLKSYEGYSAQDYAAEHVEIWERIIANPNPEPSLVWMNYDREASQKEALETIKEVSRLLQAAS